MGVQVPPLLPRGISSVVERPAPGRRFESDIPLTDATSYSRLREKKNRNPTRVGEGGNPLAPVTSGGIPIPVPGGLVTLITRSQVQIPWALRYLGRGRHLVYTEAVGGSIRRRIRRC